jgi:hypothetical protein
MCIRRFVVILASCCVLGLFAAGAGCNQAQRRDLDAAKKTVQSPLGDFIPEPLRSAALATIAALEAIGLAYVNRKRRQSESDADASHADLGNHRTTLSTVIQAIEGLQSDAQKQVKDAIGKRMVQDSLQNTVIDELKANPI